VIKIPTLYLDKDEMRLKRFNFSFLGATKPLPSEGLTTPVAINKGEYEIREADKDIVRCVRKDGKEGDFEAYAKEVEKELNIPESQKQAL